MFIRLKNGDFVNQDLIGTVKRTEDASVVVVFDKRGQRLGETAAFDWGNNFWDCGRVEIIPARSGFKNALVSSDGHPIFEDIIAWKIIDGAYVAPITCCGVEEKGGIVDDSGHVYWLGEFFASVSDYVKAVVAEREAAAADGGKK